MPFLDEKKVKLSRVLTGRGTAYRGNPGHRESAPYRAVEDIEHARIKTKCPQPTGIVARPRKTMVNEFHRVAYRE